jgi:predicted kinase
MVAGGSGSRKMTRLDMPLLVVVTGPPAAGKTTVARALAARLQLPLIAKDTIKEALFDGLGTGDLAWSQKLGDATYRAMFALVEDSVAAGASLILEGNLVRGSELEAGLGALPARFFQVHCSAPLEVLIERYGSRARHPGHVDAERIAALRDAVETGRHELLDLPGKTVRLETTQPIDLEALAVCI